jgi:IMP dehydrogenase
MIKGLDFDDVLLVPNYSHFESRKDVSTTARLGRYEFAIPVVSANMDTITGVMMSEAIARAGGLPILHRFMDTEANVRMYREVRGGQVVGVSVGVTDGEQERFEWLYAAGARIFCVDVAHAHNKLVGKMIKRMRDYKDVFIVAGNVATYAGADYLASIGAGAVKVGIGAGSVCTTRDKTGFGVPQLSAIMDCSRVDIPIIADGGLRRAGDVVKALAAGASMVMLGGMLAGTDEALGGTTYRGMASMEAQEDYFGLVADWKTAEGIAITVDRRGPVDGVIKDVMGGLRSGMTYAGAQSLSDLRRKATFMEVTRHV